MLGKDITKYHHSGSRQQVVIDSNPLQAVDDKIIFQFTKSFKGTQLYPVGATNLQLKTEVPSKTKSGAWLVLFLFDQRMV